MTNLKSPPIRGVLDEWRRYRRGSRDSSEAAIHCAFNWGRHGTDMKIEGGKVSRVPRKVSCRQVSKLSCVKLALRVALTERTRRPIGEEFTERVGAAASKRAD